MRYLILAPLLLAAVPASAQIWPGPTMAGPSGRSLGRDLRATDAARTVSEIWKARQGDRLAQDRARHKRERTPRAFRYHFAQIDVLEARYAAGGLSPSEEAELFVLREKRRNGGVAMRSSVRY